MQPYQSGTQSTTQADLPDWGVRLIRRLAAHEPQYDNECVTVLLIFEQDGTRKAIVNGVTKVEVLGK